MRRRHVLAALPALGTAGCLGTGLPLGGGSSDGTELRDLSVGNFHDEPHVVHLLVEYDGEVVHRQSYDVEAVHEVTEDGTTYDKPGWASVPCAWPAEPGRIVLRARVDDRESWKTFDLAEEPADCLHVKGIIDRKGEFDFWSSSDCAPQPRDPSVC
ncbi:hypothetical protein DMJ13_09900 [halophilic archaeon]|nr:hypothetical protein DMJ13_09900 [halophilic archaeon]